MKKLIGFLVITAVVIFITNAQAFSYQDVSPQELKEKMAKPDNRLIILDVREADEVADCRIPESINIPLAEVSKRLNELDREKELVVYCAAGVRSVRASKIIDSAGFKKVKNLKGGIRSWIASGGTIVGQCR